MIAFPKRLFYAVEAVLYIAYNAGQGPISSRDIAAKQGLTPRYLEQIMQKLVHAGILRGVRGPRGGYVLARERRRVTVGDICKVLAEDEEADLPTATPLGREIVEPLWASLRDDALVRLSQVNMAELCEQATEKNIRKASEERLDFAI